VRVGWIARLAIECVLQAVGRAWPQRLSARPSRRQRERRLETARLMTVLGRTEYYEQNLLVWATASLASINLAEAARAPSAAGGAYASMAYLAAVLRLERLAQRWWGRAAESADARSRADALIGQALHAFGHARWDACEHFVDLAVDLTERTRDRFALESALTVRLFQQHYTAHFDRALQTGREMVASARSRESLQRELWGQNAIASAELSLGRLEEALARLDEAEALLDQADSLSKETYHELRIRAYLAADDHAAIERSASAARTLRSGISSLAFGTMRLDAVLVEASAKLWIAARGRDSQRARSHRAAARASLKNLRKPARMFPYARPGAALVEGHFWHASGSVRRAVRAWRRALTQGERLRMPLEQAQALEQLGRVSPGGGVAQLEKALAIFRQHDCALKARSVEQLLEARGRGAARRSGTPS
jgi:tetratricopeptide (TPR) repeat protein